jgi:hypothetical protein
MIDEIRKPVKRYTFDIPAGLYEDLARSAEENETSIVETLRKFIRLGVIASKPGTVILLRKEDHEQPVMLVM